MPTYCMGEAIREMRLRLGYTQEELAYGICTPGTLSRIENGRAVMSKQVFESLCSRMPGLHHAWVSCDTKKEMQRSKLCKQILSYLELRRMPEARSAMAQYSCLKDETNRFCLQFEYYTQAICQAILREREEEVLPKLEKALQITMPCYRERFYTQKRNVILSYDEIYILSNMGIAYAKRNDMELSLWILHYLKDYVIRQNLDMAEAQKIGPMVFGNLAWIFKELGRYNEAEKQCEEGIKICRFSGKYNVLPYLLCIRAYCASVLGDAKTAAENMRQAKGVLELAGGYRGYGSFAEFYEASEPVYVTF